MVTDPLRVVDHEGWLQARLALLEREKEVTRLNDEVARARRAMPWEQAENYVFQDWDGPVSLGELFEGRSQLLVYHFMFAPDWEAGCKSCSLLADHFNPSVVHLAARDVTLVVVSKAPVKKLHAFRQRMDWSFRWVSSAGTRFNEDHQVSFTEEEVKSGRAYYNYKQKGFPSMEAPGISVFAKASGGELYHTYSVYERGLDRFITAYQLLDLMPKGRDETNLAYGMEWVQLHDSY